MKWLLLTLPLLAVITLGACDDAGPLDPADDAVTHEVLLDAVRAGPSVLSVMSWNVYVGADLTQLLAADPTRIACAVADVYGDVLATDFGARAVAIADQIEAHQPHVVGLNEVSTFDFQHGFFHEDLVFMDVLMDELTARGLQYDAPVAARSTNFQITLPISYDLAECAPQDGLSYTEYDVLLVRRDVELDDAAHGNFSVPLPLPYGLPPKYSGWAYVDIEHKALPYRVFTTHLEPADTGPCATDNSGLLFIHGEQASDLMDILDDDTWTHPVILTGDLNSDASGCTTDTYPDLIEAGFVDAWDIGRPRGNGFTSNQDADLLNATSELWHRIDFILYRDDFTTRTGNFRGSSHAGLVGAEQTDRVVSSATGPTLLLWPSDHAGVVADLRIAPGRGQQ